MSKVNTIISNRKNNLKKFDKFFSVIYSTACILIVWYILHMLLKSFVVPNPSEVIRNFIDIFFPKLLKHLFASGARIIIALIITAIIGMIIGLGIGTSKNFDKLFSPIVYMIYPVPRIAFLPVFMILFGLGNTSKIILIIAIAVFHIIISVRDGVKEIPKSMYTSVYSLGLSKWQILIHLTIPAILPKFFTSLRIVLGSSMAALFFAENYATKLGIGYFIMNSWVKVNYVDMYSGIIAISLFGILFFKGIDLLEKKYVHK